MALTCSGRNVTASIFGGLNHVSVRALDKVADNQPSDGMPRTDCLSLASTNVPSKPLRRDGKGVTNLTQ